MGATANICLVGAGVIAAAHAEAIASTEGLATTAVVDPQGERLDAFAARWRIPHRYRSIEDALEGRGFDAVHVLTPPDLHVETARPFLLAGLSCLVEKPLAADSAGAQTLLSAAEQGGARLGVNQNFVFDPAFAKLAQRVEAGEIGPLRQISVVYRAPLRQLAARQFGHWMFRKPVNILLEQAVHPLSQIVALAGPMAEIAAGGARFEDIGGGRPFLRSLTATLDGAACPVSFHFAVGESHPVWRLEAFGTDGSLVADMYASRVYRFGRTRALDAIDQPLSAAATAGALLAGSIANTATYALSQIRLAPRSDPFFRSMKASIAAFHGAGDHPGAPLDGAFGADLLRLCERLAEAGLRTAPAPRAPVAAAPVPSNGRGEVALIGGTGFIGAHTVDALLRAGWRVGVMARSVGGLDPVFSDPRVRLVRGDARRREDVERAIGEARLVVNLAHGGGGDSYAAIRAAMLGGAETVAEVALAKGVERLIHIGSIASVYLGADAGTVADPAPPDPRAEARADYARAKADVDRRLDEMRRLMGLPLVLLRPGLVVGAGTSPLHSGLGAFNNEQHCLGWNAGRNPLPFVLAEDVADAIIRSLTAPAAIGKSYLIVGDARPSARDYIAQLAKATGRPLRYHPSSPTGLWLTDIGKWSVKRVGGRKPPFPSRRDILSRGLGARIDAAAAKTDLGWTPEADLERFYARAFAERRAGA